MNSVAPRRVLVVVLVLIGAFLLLVAGLQLYFALHGVRDIVGDRTSVPLGTALVLLAFATLVVARAVHRAGK